MATFNPESYSNLTNITQIFDTANSFTSGTLGLGIWLLITFGSFFLMSKFNSKEGIIASGFISLITGLFLAYMGLLAGIYVMIALTIYVIGFIFLLFNKGSGGV